MKKYVFLFLFLIICVYSSRTKGQNPCGAIEMCAYAATDMYLPGLPLPVTVCPYDGGTKICCTTCPGGGNGDGPIAQEDN